MRINTNLTAMNTFTQYTKNNNKIADSVEKLSSGYAINSAADNAAGLAISEKMRAQIRGLEQASVNSQDAISLIQTAEGGLNESTEILQRMRELAVQSANDTNENEIDREALQDEFAQLQEELNNIANTTTFNKKNLLDGSLAKKQATTQNLSLQNAGLSVSLGNVGAGNYNFEAVVRVESAEVEAITAKGTAVSTDSKVSVSDVNIAATDSLDKTSLANGNYDIEASWNDDTKEMTLTAKGDNGQTFTATLTKNDLDTYAGTDQSDKMDIAFMNGSTQAFTMKLGTSTTYSTTNASTMETVAKEISDSVSVSMSGGVDHKDATYALYATMTGAEDVKLSAGMDSVSFSNGVTVSFDELTVSDVTVNADDYADQTATATKAVYELDLTGGTTGGMNGKKIDGETVTWDTDLAKTMDNFVKAYNAKTDKAYEASYANGKLTLTAKEGGAVTTDPTTEIDNHDGAALNPAVAAKYTTSSANSTSITSGTSTAVTIAGKEYTVTFDSSGNYNAAQVTAKWVEAYNADVTNTEWTAAVDGNTPEKVVFTAKTAGALRTTGATAPTGTTVTTAGADASGTADVAFVKKVEGADAPAATGKATFKDKFSQILTADTASEATAAKFEVSYAGVGAVTNSAATKLTIGGIDVNGANTAAATTDGYGAAFNGKTYTDANGVVWDITADADNDKLVFTAKTKGADVKIPTNGDDVTFAGAAVTSSTADIAGATAGVDAIAVGDPIGHGESKSSFTVEVDQGAGLTFQIGANQGDELVINVDRMDAEYLGVASANVLSRESATEALSAVDNALNEVASQRAYLGAMQNRLDHKIANLDTSAENLTAAEGQIRDVDMAKQMTEFTNANILSQAATAMLAQANSLPQNVLSLIG